MRETIQFTKPLMLIPALDDKLPDDRNLVLLEYPSISCTWQIACHPNRWMNHDCVNLISVPRPGLLHQLEGMTQTWPQAGLHGHQGLSALVTTMWHLGFSGSKQ